MNSIYYCKTSLAYHDDAEAVRELTKQTIPWKCDYYTLLIMYGYENENLIDGGDKNLVHKFIGCGSILE